MRRLVALALFACNSASPPALTPAPPAAAKPLAKAHRSEVHVDRRVELISIVERLAGTEEYKQAPATAYVADVDRTFAPFANHLAVQLTRALRNKAGIAYDAPMVLAVHLDDHFRPRGDLATLLPELDKRWQGVDIAGYVAALQAFAAASKLDDFFAAHRDYFTAVEGRLQSRLDAEDPVSWFDAFFGPSGARFVVVPGLLEGGENYGVHTNVASTPEMYQVIGLSNPDEHGLPSVDEETIRLLVHEMAHSFVNPIFDRHPELLPAGEAIYALVAQPMKEQAYGNAKIMLDEAGVRAVVVLYVRDRKGAQAAADATFAEVARSFIWTGELADVFAAYRKSGAQSFDAYMPRVAAFFDELAKRYAHGLPATPFRGTIDGVGAGKLVVTTSSDPAVTSYAKRVHDRFFAAAPFAVASDHVLADHPDVGVMAYGTPQTNPVIAAVASRAQWVIDDREIRLGGKTFTGEGLVLIACWPRQDDPIHGIVVYAGARSSDIVDINRVMAGGTDWVVARKHPDGAFEMLARGNFGHAPDGSWLPPQ